MHSWQNLPDKFIPQFFELITGPIIETILENLMDTTSRHIEGARFELMIPQEGCREKGRSHKSSS